MLVLTSGNIAADDVIIAGSGVGEGVLKSSEVSKGINRGSTVALGCTSTTEAEETRNKFLKHV